MVFFCVWVELIAIHIHFLTDILTDYYDSFLSYLISKEKGGGSDSTKAFRHTLLGLYIPIFAEGLE